MAQDRTVLDLYKQFFSGRTERYVRWRLVEDDVTRRSEPISEPMINASECERIKRRLRMNEAITNDNFGNKIWLFWDECIEVLDSVVADQIISLKQAVSGG